MAGMTTVLTEYSNNGDSRTSTYTGHTAIEPKLVIEKRSAPAATMAEFSVKTVCTTDDADGVVMSQKPSIETIIRYPKLGTYADVTAALAVHRDVVAGDEFTNSAETLEWLT